MLCNMLETSVDSRGVFYREEWLAKTLLEFQLSIDKHMNNQSNHSRAKLELTICTRKATIVPPAEPTKEVQRLLGRLIDW